MGLLITLYLIMMNTYGGVQHSGPQDRGIGVIEIWGLACVSCIFIAMIEYAIILYKMKSEHDTGCTLQYKNKKLLNGKCCNNHRFRSWDNRCLVMIPIFFFLFNVVFWTRVSSLQNWNFDLQSWFVYFAYFANWKKNKSTFSSMFQHKKILNH